MRPQPRFFRCRLDFRPAFQLRGVTLDRVPRESCICARQDKHKRHGTARSRVILTVTCARHVACMRPSRTLHRLLGPLVVPTLTRAPECWPLRVVVAAARAQEYKR